LWGGESRTGSGGWGHMEKKKNCLPPPGKVELDSRHKREVMLKV
jgi:hypothetical protein